MIVEIAYCSNNKNLHIDYLSTKVENRSTNLIRYTNSIILRQLSTHFRLLLLNSAFRSNIFKRIIWCVSHFFITLHFYCIRIQILWSITILRNSWDLRNGSPFQQQKFSVRFSSPHKWKSSQQTSSDWSSTTSSILLKFSTHFHLLLLEIILEMKFITSAEIIRILQSNLTWKLFRESLSLESTPS